MDLWIDERIIEQYPSLRVGVIVCKGIQNSKENPELTRLKNQLEDQFMNKYRPEDINTHSNILAWRETYRSFGVKPKDHKPTAEALLRRIVRGDRAPIINVAVNCYLLSELEYFLPVGGYDLDRITDSIKLHYSTGGEPFIPLGGKEAEGTPANEIVYSDGPRVITRRWNYRDSEETKITEDTTNCALFCEAADPSIPTDDVIGTAKSIANYIQQFCGGTINYFLADVSKEKKWKL